MENYAKEAATMALPIKDILLLDYFDGKPLHTQMPSYLQSTYGKDAQVRIDRLYADGWIRESKPQETLNMLPDKALSDFLKKHGLSGEGSHAELVRRIISEIAEKEYAHGVPKIYVVEQKGKAEIGHHMAYILNVREKYGLTEGEIGESKAALALKGNPYTARDVLARAFHQKISIYTMAGEWSKLRNLYYIIANFHLRGGEQDKTLSYLFLVFFLDMSGMGNKNTVTPYENLFPTQKGMVLLMDELRHKERMTVESVRSAFLSSIARMAPRLPFSYFSPQIMADQLLERLRGVPFNGAKYIADKNVPDASSKAYHYVPWGRNDAKKEQEPPKFSRPKIMAPPVLRMPAFTAPAPFESTEDRKRREERMKRAAVTRKRPVIEKEEKKGIWEQFKKWL